jgi:hypothetical protein
MNIYLRIKENFREVLSIGKKINEPDIKFKINALEFLIESDIRIMNRYFEMIYDMVRKKRAYPLLTQRLF